MTVHRDPDVVVAAWLDEGPTALPSATRRAVVLALPLVRQRRRGFAGLGSLATPAAVWWVARAAAGLLVIVLAASWLPGLGPMGAPRPSPTPTSTPGSSPSPSAAPTATPPPSASPRIPGASVLRDGTVLEAGVRYVLQSFDPAFTFTGSGLVFGIDGEAYAWFGHPAGLEVAVGVVRPGAVFAVGGSTESVPSDIVAWLQDRADLSIASVTSLALGSRQGVLLEGAVAGDAIDNAGGAVNLVCPATIGCDFESGGSLGYAPGDHVLILVVDAGGTPVVAMASAPETRWAAIRVDVDAFLRSFEFPS